MSKKEIKLTPSKIRKKRSNNLQLSRNIYSTTFLASAFGLHQLVLLYIEWDEKNNGETEMED